VPVAGHEGEISQVLPLDLARGEDNEIVATALHFRETHASLTPSPAFQINSSVPPSCATILRLRVVYTRSGYAYVSSIRCRLSRKVVNLTDRGLAE
jgi:hypothetical protein